MLGHASVKQTEEYAITEQQTIGRNMQVLKQKLFKETYIESEEELKILSRLEKEIKEMKEKIKIRLDKADINKPSSDILQGIQQKNLKLQKNTIESFKNSD